MNRLPNLPRFGLLAVVGATLVFLLLPLAVVLVAAFNDGPVLSFPPTRWTTRWFGAISPEFWASLRLSLSVAAINAVIATLAGVPVALVLSRLRWCWRGALHALCLSPLMVPTLVIAVGAYQVGLQVFDLTGVSYLGTAAGLAVGHSVLGLPFVVRSVIAADALSDPDLEDAARSLGAGRIETFWRVTLPLLSSGVLAGAVFAFIVSFEDVSMSLFLGAADVPTLPVRIYGTVEFSLDGDVMAMSALVIAASLALLLLVDRAIGIERVLRPDHRRAAASA